MYFHYMSLLFPCGKGCGPLFKQVIFPISQGLIVKGLVEIGLVGLVRKIKLWKVFKDNYVWKQAIDKSC